MPYFVSFANLPCASRTSIPYWAFPSLSRQIEMLWLDWLVMTTLTRTGAPTAKESFTGTSLSEIARAPPVVLRHRPAAVPLHAKTPARNITFGLHDIFPPIVG